MERHGEIIFSLLEETVWASWDGQSKSVALGHYGIVTHMMRDFLAQCALGEELSKYWADND